MHINHNDNERGLIKIIKVFRKKAESLIKMEKLGPEHQKVIVSCENLIKQLNDHALYRESILAQRENLKALIRDNASCPECHKNSYLKFKRTETHEQGWKSNRYKCRKCNIEFTWNRPNNPWDMLLFIEEYKKAMDAKILLEQDPQLIEQAKKAVDQMMITYNQLKPVLEAADQQYKEYLDQEAEMTKMIKEFRSFLLIEKIKMDSIEEE